MTEQDIADMLAKMERIAVATETIAAVASSPDMQAMLVSAMALSAALRSAVGTNDAFRVSSVAP